MAHKSQVPLMGAMPPMDQVVEGVHARNACVRKTHSAATTPGTIHASICATMTAEDAGGRLPTGPPMGVLRVILQDAMDVAARRVSAN